MQRRLYSLRITNIPKRTMVHNLLASALPREGVIRFRVCLSLALFSLFLHSLQAQSPEMELIYVKHSDRFESEAVNGQQVTTFVGNVEIEHDETRITCDKATYFKDEGRVLLNGDVDIVQTTRSIWADRIEYFERTREVIGVGDLIKIVDFEKGVTAIGGHVQYCLESESGILTRSPSLVKKSEDGRIEASLEGDTLQIYSQETIVVARGDSVRLVDRENDIEIRGTFLSYDYEQRYGIATQGPTILKRDEEEKAFVTVMSDTAEVFSKDELFVTSGNVRIERAKFRAQGDRALFKERGERITLKGNPILQQSSNRLIGDEIELSLDSLSLTKVASIGNARATSASGGDSLDESADVSEMSGKHIALYLKNEEAESLVVTGNATSLYQAKEGQRSGAVNEASGDTIILFFHQGELNRTLILGGARGTYYLPPSTKEESVDTVVYRSDRIDYTIPEETIFLDRNNRIEYQDIVLTAGHITFNTATEILTAEGVPDSAGQLIATPVLKDGKEEIEGTWLNYNLKSKRGKIKKGETQFEKGFYKGEKIRKVADKVLNIDHGTYTTCDLDTSHYHFYTRRMKFYQDDKVIAKPVVLYFGNVPVFILPFYIFPIKKGRHSGLLIPRYGSTEADGRYLRDAGYYFAPSDYWDTLFKMSLYEKTGWMFESRFRYALRYKFNGTVSGSYRWDRRIRDFREIQSTRWNIRFDHNQTITPTLTMKASGDFVSDTDYYQNVSESATERMKRTLRSELVLDKRWEGSSLNLRLNQQRNLDSDQTTENIPILTFRKSQSPIFGSRDRNRTGENENQTEWYRSLYYSYNFLFVNWHQKREDVSEGHVGADHRIDFSGSQSIAGWLGINPRVRLRETWFDEDKEGKKWVRRGYYEASLSANTTLYGLFRPGIGPLTLLRHKIQPRLSFSYRPDFEERDRYFSFGGIGGIPGPQKSLGIGISNYFQGKTTRGEEEKKFDIATFDLSTGYNFRAEDQKFNPVSSVLRVNPSTSLNIDLSTSHSLYDRESGEFMPWQPALQNMSLTTTLRLKSEGRGQPVTRREESLGEYGDITSLSSSFEERGWGEEVTAKESTPWNARVTHYYSISKTTFSRRTQWLDGRFSFYLTKNWQIDYSTKYDIEEKRFTSQRVAFYRDLHCWEAQLVWIPTGGREGYFFRINVKALPELKIERGKGISGLGL